MPTMAPVERLLLLDGGAGEAVGRLVGVGSTATAIKNSMPTVGVTLMLAGSRASWKIYEKPA